MIDFAQYTRMQHLHKEDKLTHQQIAQKLSLDSKTVAKWLKRERFDARKNAGRSSKLDPHKALIRTKRSSAHGWKSTPTVPSKSSNA